MGNKDKSEKKDVQKSKSADPEMGHPPSTVTVRKGLPALRREIPRLRMREVVFMFWLAFTLFMAFLALRFKSSNASYILLIIIIMWGLVWCRSGDYSLAPGKNSVACWGFIFIVMEFGVMYYYWVIAEFADPSSVHSPCGKSSCVPERNPNGWYKSEAPFMRCPYIHCRWGDVNELPIVGYYSSADSAIVANLSRPCVTGDTSCPSLASRIKADYPDPGTCLVEDWFEGVTTLSTAMAPGVDQVAFNGVTDGRGIHVCSSCSKYMYAKYNYGDSSYNNCPGDVDDAGCELCVDTTMYQQQWERNGIYVLFMLHIGACVLLIVARLSM